MRFLCGFYESSRSPAFRFKSSRAHQIEIKAEVYENIFHIFQMPAFALCVSAFSL
jgi:hypothetical protein